MSEQELQVLHEQLKDVLKEFSDLCDNLDIVFYLAYGSMLGAARHSDIIPWDDDIDVSMYRDDYDKLIDFYKNNPQTGSKLYCYELDNKCFFNFAKYVSINPSRNDTCVRKYYTHPDGLSIDIFPLDKAYPPNNLRQKINNIQIKLIYRVIWNRYVLDTDKQCRKRLLREIFTLPFVFIRNKTLMEWHQNKCKRMNIRLNVPNVINYTTLWSLANENDCADDWKPVKIAFGGVYYNVPCGYRTMLSKIYGTDWNEIPPEHKKKMHDHV